jgi:hypothetical protein
MKIKHHISTALVRLYPLAWRNEYGPELTDILLSGRLSARVIADVVWNSLRQRARSPEPSTVMGLTMMLAVLGGLVWNIASPTPNGLAALLRPSTKTLPAVVVKPLSSEFYALLLVTCGCWTHLRHRGKLADSGKAAMWVSWVAGIPVILAGAFMLSGLLTVVALGPGDHVTTFHEHGFTYTYYSAQHRVPGSVNVLLSPLFALPQSYLWGLVGGKFGQWISHLIRPTSA